MNVDFKTLDGRKNKRIFLKEWERSECRLASFLLSESAIHIMPYGKFNPDVGIHFSRNHIFDSKYMERFSGPDGRPPFIARDFELVPEKIISGGYLALKKDRTGPYFVMDSRYFEKSSGITGCGYFDRRGQVEAVVEAVRDEFFS